MKNLIKKILKEEFENKDTQSMDHNICDIMTVNSLEEILSLLKKMSIPKEKKYEIKSILNSMEQEKTNLSNQKDIHNTYLRKVQNILCI